MKNECNHRWSGYFGTILRCRRCGSFTNTSAAAGESKPIFAPLTPAPRTASIAKVSGPPSGGSTAPTC